MHTPWFSYKWTEHLDSRWHQRGVCPPFSSPDQSESMECVEFLHERSPGGVVLYSRQLGTSDLKSMFTTHTRKRPACISAIVKVENFRVTLNPTFRVCPLLPGSKSSLMTSKMACNIYIINNLQFTEVFCVLAISCFFLCPCRFLLDICLSYILNWSLADRLTLSHNLRKSHAIIIPSSRYNETKKVARTKPQKTVPANPRTGGQGWGRLGCHC